MSLGFYLSCFVVNTIVAISALASLFGAGGDECFYPRTKGVPRLTYVSCFIMIAIAAISALDTFLGASGRECFRPCAKRVSSCGDLFLIDKNLVTNRAMLSCSQTCSGTGGSYNLIGCLGMRELINAPCFLFTARTSSLF